MDYKLELVLIPVKDVDRAKAFYVEKMGFNLDVDHKASEEFRVVQMTPQGSACSITLGIGITEAEPGPSAGRICASPTSRRRARSSSGRGVEVSDVRHFDREKGDGSRGPIPSTTPTRRSRTSPTRTATRGCSRRSTTRRRTRDRRRSWRTRSPGTRPRSPSSRSVTAASCTSTATGCSRRSTRPRTRCRRRSCAHGGAGRRSRATHCSARGSTGSRRTSVSTCSAPARAAGPKPGRSRRCRGCSPIRTGYSTRWRRPMTTRTSSPSRARRSSSPSSRRCRRCRHGNGRR